jgi:hypothetical protein
MEQHLNKKNNMKKNLFEISEQEKREILEKHNVLKESPKYKIGINNFITEQGRPTPNEPSRETDDSPTNDNTTVDLTKWEKIGKEKFDQLKSAGKELGKDILQMGNEFFETKWGKIVKEKFDQLKSAGKIVGTDILQIGNEFFEKIINAATSGSESTISSTTKPTVIKPDNSVYNKLVFDKPDKFDRRYIYAYLPEQIQENRRRLSEAGRWFAKNVQNNKVFDITDAYPQSVKKLEDWYPQGNVTNPQSDVTNPKGDVTNPKGDSANLKGDSANLKGDSANLKGDSANLKVDSKKAKVDTTNPNSADYYSDYQTDETESETVKKTNYNNATEEDDTTNKSNNYGDYSDVEDDGNATTANSTKSKTNQPMTFSTYYDEEPVTSKTPPVSGQPLNMELTPQQKAKSYNFS